ncbi:putative transcription factor MADS-MIKC family [Rosa chinensis]|uniref:Putative transcription factor MADS-MIKC family n=1 Tax=Rosa chinensis TaxID=74649 RepID=A0A2P6RPL2_ROSCH|nr:agamous-like MADS-box protein AGL18 [Rosa chinensis]PRQ48373.1 putative transcription factor MADS-MIKC family [Rosa chinensis]
MAMSGPRRTKIEKIEHLSSRQVTFSKRRKGLFNKAEDFSLRCGAEIAVIVFSNTKRMYEFSSTSMEHILSRYNKERAAGFLIESPENKSQHEPSSSSDSLSAIGLLQEEIRALNLDCSRLTGTELDGMSLRELNELEKKIREGIESVEKRKNEVQNYYQPSYMLEDSNRLDGNNSNFFSGTSSSAISGCTESEQSKQFVDTCLHL